MVAFKNAITIRALWNIAVRDRRIQNIITPNGSKAAQINSRQSKINNCSSWNSQIAKCYLKGENIAEFSGRKLSLNSGWDENENSN